MFISYRDGVYRVIEGQKRTLAAKMRFVSGKRLKCKVRRDLNTVEDESRWFYEINHQKRKFSETTEGFLSRKYFDDTWKSIVSCVENSGLNISYSSDRNDGCISCLTTLESVYDEFYKNDTIESFNTMLMILHNNCIGASESLMANFIKSMLKNIENISVIDEDIDDTLSTFFVRDKLYFGVHGDFDSTSDASISKLILWAKMTPYCIMCGHKHYPAMTDISGIKVVQSGSLGGSGDEYTRQKRLTGKPSQTVLVVNDKGIKCCYPIELS